MSQCLPILYYGLHAVADPGIDGRGREGSLGCMPPWYGSLEAATPSGGAGAEPPLGGLRPHPGS